MVKYTSIERAFLATSQRTLGGIRALMRSAATPTPPELPVLPCLPKHPPPSSTACAPPTSLHPWVQALLEGGHAASVPLRRLTPLSTAPSGPPALQRGQDSLSKAEGRAPVGMDTLPIFLWVDAWVTSTLSGCESRCCEHLHGYLGDLVITSFGDRPRCGSFIFTTMTLY